MLYRKVNNMICYREKVTILKYAIWESQQYDHMLYWTGKNMNKYYINKSTI